MAITSDILKKNFGFTNEGVIQGILSDPGQVARYEREYQGIINPQPTTSSADLIAKQNAAEQALFEKYGQQIATQESLPSAYTRLTTEAGVPQLQTDIQKYKQNIYNVQGLLDRLEEDVTGRTTGTLTTEAQRRRQIAAEGAPLVSELGRLTTGLQPLTEQLSTATGNVATQLGLISQQETRELLPIQARISAFSDAAAREVSLFSLDRQNELDNITMKLKQQGDLSLAEYQRATDLLKSEQDYQQKRNLYAYQYEVQNKYGKGTTKKSLESIFDTANA